MSKITAVDFPAGTSLAGRFGVVHLADAFATELPADTETDPEILARFVFSQRPEWMNLLLAVRDCLVSLVGLKTTKSLARQSGQESVERISFFRIYETHKAEIILGEDDSHLDFRVSVLVRPEQIVLATVVHCHNRLGRLYITLIAPFHRLVVKAVLRRAARAGWPAVT